ELRGRQAVVAALQLQHRDHRDEVRVAAPLAEAVDRALDLDAPVVDRFDRVGDRQLAVVVAVDGERRRPQDRPGGVDAGPDARRNGAAPRVAEADEVDARVGRRARARSRRRAEGRDLRVPEAEALAGPEELLVARVRARPAALDVVHAEVVEALGDADLVLEREGDVLGLGAVAERRVVELDASHGRGPPMNASCSARTASSVYLSSTTTEILISEVEIICTLMPSAASTSNMRAAMPAWVRM